MSQDTIFEYTKIDPWFLSQLGELHQAEQWLKTQSLDSISYDDLLATKQRGFSDVQIACCLGQTSSLTCMRHCLSNSPLYRHLYAGCILLPALQNVSHKLPVAET